MAKGGLNPGADPTIVGAAVKAGLGNVPVDLYKQYQGMADAYADAMDKVGEAVKTGITTLGTVVTPLIEEAIKTNQTLDSYAPDDIHSNWTDAIWGVDGEGGWLDELKNRRKQLRELPWGSDERKKLRREWNRDKDRLFGMIEALEEGNLVNVENIANGNWNEAATGAENSLMMTAILAKGAPLPEGHPYAGVYAKLDRDEEGEIELQLFDKDNKPISGLNPDGSIRYAGTVMGAGTIDISKLEDIDNEELERTGGQISLENSWFGSGYGDYYYDKKLEMFMEKSIDSDLMENNPELVEKITILKDLMTLTRYSEDGDQYSYSSDDNGNWNQETKTGDPQSEVLDLQRLLKKLYPDHDFGTTGPNGDGMDGNWGNKTRAAYELYKKDKQKLEQDVLNEAHLGTVSITEGDVPVDYFIPGQEVTHKHLTVSNKNIANLIVPKDQELINDLTQIGLNEIENGGKGFPFREHDVKRQVLERLKTPNQLSDAMHSPIGNMEYTYAEYLSMPNKWTAEMWTTIGGLGDKIKDVDGVEGISAGDFLGDQGVTNMQVLRDEMLNPYNQTSKELFTDFLVEGYRTEHGYGENVKGPVDGGGGDGNGDDDDGGDYVGFPSSKVSSVFAGGGGDYIDEATRNNFDSIAKAIINKTGFIMNNDTFTWDADKETWLMNGDIVLPNKDSLLKTIFTDGGNKPFADNFLSDTQPWYKQIPNWDGSQYVGTNIDNVSAGFENANPIKLYIDHVVKEIWGPSTGTQGKDLVAHLSKDYSSEVITAPPTLENISYMSTGHKMTVFNTSKGRMGIVPKNNRVYVYKWNGTTEKWDYENYWAGNSLTSRADKNDVEQILNTLGLAITSSKNINMDVEIQKSKSAYLTPKV